MAIIEKQSPNVRLTIRSRLKAHRYVRSVIPLLQQRPKIVARQPDIFQPPVILAHQHPAH